MPAALEARGYAYAGRLVLDLLAPPVEGGRSGSGARAMGARRPAPTARRVAPPAEAEPADLRLDVTALGSLYLGGFPASLACAAGRVEELTSGSLAVADTPCSRPGPHL